MPKLFEDDDEISKFEIKTNTEYATHYNKWRQKEELNKLKTKYGDVTIDESDEDSSSSSDDDEISAGVNEEFEKDFFKTLACLKKKDPSIYDNKIKFFTSETDDNVKNKNDSSKNKKQEPLLLKNYEKKMILKTGGKFEYDDDSDSEEDDPRTKSPTYVEEQARLKESFKKVLSDDEVDENNWGGLFTKRVKTKEEQQQEEDDYTKWLKGQKNELENKQVETELKPLKDYWSDPKLDKDEKFLRDYLLNKRYLEKEDGNYVPTYEEIVHDSDDNLSEDEKNIDDQEEFETKYNYRYEEPDQEFIKRYPRTMENSVRKTDDRRKLKRQEIKERKEQEKNQKKEELKQLKAFKQKEIEEKIMKLKEITGNNDLKFQDADLEDDFDPEAYDRRMQELFNDEYYKEDEGDLKPEFPDLAEELGTWADSNKHCEDDDFIMDCDYDPSVAKEEKAKKKRNRFDKKVKQNGIEEIVENDERYNKYMDELYQLDYEDMIGDLPCRFKYREVVPNSFGLSIEEILVAKDRELNRWCSLKKAVQHRPEQVEKYDIVAYNKKAQNEALKKKILSSLFDELEEPKEDDYIQKIKKELQNLKAESDNENNESKKEKNVDIENGEESTSAENSNNVEKKKRTKKNKKKNTDKEHKIVHEKDTEKEINTGDESNDVSKMKKNRKNKNNICDETASTIITESKLKEKKHINNKNEENCTEVKETNETEDSSKLSRRQKKNKKKLSKPKSSEENQTKKSKKRKRKNSELDNGEAPKKKKKLDKHKSLEMSLSNKRLEAYGLNPKKFKNKLKYKNKK